MGRLLIGLGVFLLGTATLVAGGAMWAQERRRRRRVTAEDLEWMDEVWVERYDA